MSQLRTSPIPAQIASSGCRVVFGARAAAIDGTARDPALRVALPLLGGADTETLLTGVSETIDHDGCTLWRTADRAAGVIVAPGVLELEAAARHLYTQVFAATEGLRLYRIWNYVPRINAVEGELENYRLFCRGRSHAFEARFGAGFQRELPAASAVGALAGPLAIAFLAGKAPARHFENPQQVPAFAYPPAYGPRPPSFSRATLVSDGARQELFISGTAAIRGHATVAPKDISEQLACTRENLAIIARTAGAGEDFGAADGWRRMLKVYVRHDTDLLQVRNDLERHVLRADDDVTYLQADLCRGELKVEIEAVLVRA